MNLACAAGAGLAAACANPPTGQLGSDRAFAVLHDAAGRSVGALELRARPGGLDVRADLHDLPDGRFALALGGRGECEVRFQPAPFASAGPPAPLGAPPAPPFEVAGGGAAVTLHAGGVALSGGASPLLDWDGSALLLERADGERRPPVACGIVRR